MKYLRLALLALGFLAAPASAQTVVGPQACPYPFYTKGVTALGVLDCSGVDFTQLSFGGLLYATNVSNTSVTASTGLIQTLGLNDATGFAVGYRAYVRNLNDPQCYFYGFITNIVPADQSITVASDIAVGGCTDTSWSVQVSPTFVWPTATTGIGTNSFAIPAVGATVSVTTQTGLLFQPGSHIVVTYTDDATQYFRGIAQSYSGTTLTIFVTDVGPSASGTYTTWNVVAQDGPSANASLTATSSTSATIAVGTQNLTIQTGKAFNPGGIVLASDASDNTNWMMGQVTSYIPASTNIAFSVFAIGGSGTKTAWTVQQVFPSFGAVSGATSGFVYPYIGPLDSVKFRGNPGSFTFSLGNADTTFTANRNLDLKIGDASRTLTINGDAILVAGTMAPTASPTFTGTPTAPTQAANDNSTKLATTAYADAAGASGYTLVPSGSGSFPAAAIQAVTIPAGKSDILIYFNGASNATAARSLQIQFSTDNGSTYDTTAANYPGATTLAGTTSNKSLASAIEPATNTLAATGVDGMVEVHGYALATYKHILSDGDNSVGLVGAWTTTGIWKNTSAITTIKFLWSGSGNFDAGTYAVYTK